MLKIKLFSSLILLLFLYPASATETEELKYIAKTKKTIKYKKKKKRKKVYIKYPHRANLRLSAEKLKMKELLKDIYE